jgi:Na+/H+ antiporter NhaD/arsenite permease-like protein
MGSLTYIGNGPNLMVREIAVHRGVRMPSFFAYTVAATAILGPILVLVTLIFYV